MREKDKLFFELIRVAIGTQDNLSCQSSDMDWKAIYEMSMKQSLVGVCFAALQRLGADANDGFARIGMSEMLYLTWMGMAAKIQQKNDKVNLQCAKLQTKLSADGLRSCILKGQGVANLYCEHLQGLRQSGDIDVWVPYKSIKELVNYANELGIATKVTAVHVKCDIFNDTEVELHSKPAFFRNFCTERKFTRWCKSFGFRFQEVNGIIVPSIEFNLVYMMVHMYHHVLFEGLGLRQVMDYYFVLKTSGSKGSNYQDVQRILKSFGMLKFAKGIMWMMKEVFALPEMLMICEPNEKVGRLLLDEIMTGGNFGHYDEKNRDLHGGTAVGRSLNGLKRNMRFFAIGPCEILCSPLWSTWHRCWRKRYGFL